MRDTFLLLWVGFLVIGVIGSIVSSARKQAQRAQSGQQPPRRVTLSGVEGPPQWQPPQRVAPSAALQVAPQPVAPKAPRPKPPPKPAPELPHELLMPTRHTRRLFDSRGAIVQAVVAAEVLGKPRGLRDEYF